MMRKFRDRAEEAPWQLISSSSSRSAPMCGTTASGRTRNDGRCTGGHNSVQYVLSYGHIYSYASTISFLQYLENKCDRRRGARDLIVGRQVKQTFPQLSPEQTCDMRPVQLDQIEGVEEHAGIMPALSDTTERRGGCRASPVRRPCGR